MINLNHDLAARQTLIVRLLNTPAFSGLPPEIVSEFANRADIRLYREGERVITQGEREDNFFVIISGELEAKDTNYDPPRSLNYHDEGDIVGLRALLRDTVRAATVEVVIDAVVAVYGQDDWKWLINQDTQISGFFEKIERTFDERSKGDFPGRRPNEIIVAHTKRHPIALAATLTWPLILLIVSVIVLIAAELIEIPLLSLDGRLPFLVFFLLIATSALMVLYNFLDWYNDDLFVTTKRVVHIERILFLSEERHEAPLTQIQNVAIKSHGFFDLIFDVDDIIITTAGTSPLIIDNIPTAQVLGQIILDEQARAKARVASADIKSVRQLLDQRLKRETTAAPKPGKAGLKEIPRRRLLPALPKLKLGYFVPRVKEFRDIKIGEKVEKNSIAWRKHYFILLSQIILPVLAFIISLSLLLTFSFTWPIQILFGLAVLASLVWYIWEYDDWQRDVYIVTDTRIIDVESSSFRLRGEEQREGSFDSIQDINYKIPNFFYKLLNLGNVVIRTAGGGQSFTFEKVFRPSSVQEEIFNRWDKFQQQKREKTQDNTNKQIVTVVGEYHDGYHGLGKPTP